MTEALRPPFVWTPRQQIDPTGGRSVYLGGGERPLEKNRWFLFRRTVDLPGKPRAAPVRITVDGRYILYVNGQKVGRGPVRATPLYQRCDDYDLAAYLKPGENALALLVHTYGTDTAFYETVKGMWRSVFGDGGVFVDGDADGIALGAAAGWRCTQSAAWTQDAPQSNHSLGFIEDLDGAALIEGWTEPGFDDSGWDEARALIAGGGGAEAPYGGMVIRPFPTLLPRGIPMLEERPQTAARVVWVKGLVPDPAMPFHRRAYEEPLVEAPAGALKNEGDLLRLDSGAAVVCTEPGRDVAILLDFGRIMTGRPRVEIEARGGEIVEIACAESLPGEWNPEGPNADARITPKPWLGEDKHLCRYRARAGVQTFERFEWCAIRWMQLVVRDAPEGLVIRGLGATLVNYPVEERGRFASSDAFLDKLWATGAYTLRQCMHDAWEDCPSREQRQWLGDVTVENLVGHAAFGPCVAPLNAKYLAQVAESQRPDGLTQMFAPGDHRVNGLLIPDWTLQWVLTAGDHLDLTGDLDTVEAIFPSILKALAWFERLLDGHGLIADMPYWHFMDWSGVGREGEAGALNAQLAGAFRVASRLAEALGWRREAERLSLRAQAIGRAIEARHWDVRRGCYVDIVDPVTGKQDLRVSQHVNAAVALWGESSPERTGSALDRISSSNRLTFTAGPPIAPRGETLDPDEGVVLANTFYSHFVYEALGRHGRFDQALRLMRERFGPMLDKGATTLWESFAPTASLCHGFSASPTHQLSRRMLGVAPAAPGFDAIAITPDLAGLEHAEGAVPTRHGDVTVKLAREGEGFAAQVQAPAGIPATLKPPAGLQVATTVTASADGRMEARFIPAG